jgi:hypothetical protein
MKLKVEQPAAGRPEVMGSHVEVDSDTTAKTEEDHLAGLMEEYRLDGTWVEHSQ